MLVRALFCVVVILLASRAMAQSPDELIAKLKSLHAKDRRVAAEELGKRMATEACAQLVVLLGDDVEGVRDAAVDALANMGAKAVPALTTALSDRDGTIRLGALSALAKLGPLAKDAQPALKESLRDKTVEIRIRAAVALGEQVAEAKTALPALFEAAKDTGNVGAKIRPRLPSSVSNAAVTAALKIDPKCAAEIAKAALPDLIAALKSGDEAVLMAAGDSLKLLGTHAKTAIPALKDAQKRAKGFAVYSISGALTAAGDDPIPALVDRINDADSPLKARLNAVRDLDYLRIDETKVQDALLSLCKHHEPAIRTAAVDSFRQSRSRKPAALPILLDLLSDAELEKATRTRDNGFYTLIDALTYYGTAAVPGLAEILKDVEKSPLARYQAAKTLSKLGILARSALPALEETLKDKYMMIALESACAYARAGGDPSKVMAILRAGLKYDADAVVGYAVDVADRIGRPAQETVPLLRPLLKHKDSEMRIGAAHALSRMGEAAKPTVPALAGLLKSGDARERFQVAVALEQLGPIVADALPALIERLQDLEETSSHPVLLAIGNLGPEAKTAVPELMALLKKERAAYRNEVFLTLGKIGPAAKAAVPMIVAELSHRSEFHRSAAARALGGIGPNAKDAVPALEKLLEDESKSVRVWAAYALARITGKIKQNLAVIIEVWNRSPDMQSMWHAAAEAFVLMGADARPARDLLLAAVLDGKTLPGIARTAARALGQLGDNAETIVPELIAALKRPSGPNSPDPEAIMEALATLGPKAKAAIPELKKWLDGDDVDLAQVAVKALMSIEKK